MNITEIPFNNYIGIRESDNNNYIFMIDDSYRYLNHLGTVHASAQFALAEATSGEYLLKTFKEHSDNIIPVVRRVEIKYSKPAKGFLYSKAEVGRDDIERVIADIKGKGRTLVRVKVEIFDQQDNLTMQSEYEWFVQKIKE